AAAGHDARVHQRRQAFGQNVRRYPEAVPELLETGRSLDHRVAHDQQRPGVAHHVEGTGDRAGRVLTEVLGHACRLSNGLLGETQRAASRTRPVTPRRTAQNRPICAAAGRFSIESSRTMRRPTNGDSSTSTSSGESSAARQSRTWPWASTASRTYSPAPSGRGATSRKRPYSRRRRWK